MIIEETKKIILTPQQQARLYKVFDFEDHEEILTAELEQKTSQITIYYFDNIAKAQGRYEPNLEGKEGAKKFDYILEGKVWK